MLTTHRSTGCFKQPSTISLQTGVLITHGCSHDYCMIIRGQETKFEHIFTNDMTLLVMTLIKFQGIENGFGFNLFVIKSKFVSR